MKSLCLALAFLSALFAPTIFAADVTVTQTVVAVAATSTATSTRESRRLLILSNVSDVAISCKFGATAVAGEGIVLNPQPASGSAGGVAFFDVAIPVGTLNCIHGGSGTKNLSVVEG